MGSMQFLLPRRPGLAEFVAECAYLVGHDGTPWETHVEDRAGRLSVRRDTRESGRLIAPWVIPGMGTIALSTATLLPREQPYHLALELCRGTLARITSQFADSVLNHLVVAPLLQTAKQHFVAAALGQRNVEQCAMDAETALALCLQVIGFSLGASPRPGGGSATFCSRLTGFQTDRTSLPAAQQHGKLPGNALFYSDRWRDAEPNPGEYAWQGWEQGLKAVRQARRRVAAGPLFRLTRQDLPDWLYLWDDDFDALRSYLTAYIHASVRKLQPLVQLWYTSAGTNIESELHLGEEQRLRLTLAAIEALRNVDAQTPALVGIRQPWGEYLGRTGLDLSPWQFADILVRADVGISGFVLEMNLAATTGRTMPRDLLELTRLIDHWAALGLPLVIQLSTPSGGPAAPQVESRQLDDYLYLLQQKPIVQGIIWNQIQDEPNWPAGILDATGQPKPVLTELQRIWKSRPASA